MAKEKEEKLETLVINDVPDVLVKISTIMVFKHLIRNNYIARKNGHFLSLLKIELIGYFSFNFVQNQYKRQATGIGCR